MMSALDEPLQAQPAVYKTAEEYAAFREDMHRLWGIELDPSPEELALQGAAASKSA